MATNLPHIVSGSSSTPLTGQPFNFHGILDCYLLPRVVASDSALLPGARLLWAVIRNYSSRDGRCTLSDAALAAAVGVGERHVRNYCRQLEDAGLLRTTQRPGKTPERELLWEARFAGKIRPTPALGFRPPGTPVPPPRNSSSGVYKEESSSKTSSKTKTATIETDVPSAAPSLPARKPAAEWSEEDYKRRGRECGFPEHVIQRDIERMRARRAKPTDERLVTAAEVAEQVDPSIPR